MERVETLGFATGLWFWPVSESTHWCLQKNALQWTKSPTANESGDGTGTSTGSTTATVEGAEQESCDSTEATAASGENDGVWTIHSFQELINSPCFPVSGTGLNIKEAYKRAEK